MRNFSLSTHTYFSTNDKFYQQQQQQQRNSQAQNIVSEPENKNKKQTCDFVKKSFHLRNTHTHIIQIGGLLLLLLFHISFFLLDNSTKKKRKNAFSFPHQLK